MERTPEEKRLFEIALKQIDEYAGKFGKKERGALYTENKDGTYYKRYWGEK